MPKCMYRCETSGTCCRSTSENHCQQITDEICHQCVLNQDKPMISDKQRFKNIIKGAIKLLKINDTKEALRVLNSAMKI